MEKETVTFQGNQVQKDSLGVQKNQGTSMKNKGVLHTITTSAGRKKKKLEMSQRGGNDGETILGHFSGRGA